MHIEWRKPRARMPGRGECRSPGFQGVQVRLEKEGTEEKISLLGKGTSGEHSFRQGGFEVPGRYAAMR